MPNLTTYPAYDDRGFPIELKQWEEKQDIKAVVELSWKSFSCKVRNPKPKVNRRGKKGNKRRLHGFSMQSSKYLKKIMSMIARGDTPYLLTLTMPQIVDSKRFKRYLQNFADFFRIIRRSLLEKMGLQMKILGSSSFGFKVYRLGRGERKVKARKECSAIDGKDHSALIMTAGLWVGPTA